MTSVTPPLARLSTSRSMIGTCPTGSIGFGVVSVSGRSRVPNPPTSTTARISRLWWLSPARRAGRRPRWWSHRQRACRRRGGRAGDGRRRCHVAAIRGAQGRQLVPPNRACGMSVPLGTNATTNTMPSLVMRMLLKSVTTSWYTSGCRGIVPHPDDEFRVLAVALGVFGRPRLATLVCRHHQFGVGELDVVHVEEHTELGAVAGRLGRSTGGSG